MYQGIGKKLLIAVSLAALAGTAEAGEMKTSYLYNLSDFTGAKTYTSAKIALDGVKNEIYAMSGEAVTVFNSSGMEVFKIDYDPSVGVVQDVAVDPSGDLLILTLKERKVQIVRCNFRGEPVSSLELKNMPEKMAGYSPDRIFFRDGRLYLASLGAMALVVTDENGNYLETFDLAAKVGLTDQERLDSGIGCVNFDGQGSLLFTIPTMGKVYRMAKDGQMSSFGKRGSAPGKFGVVTGVAADKDGNIIVADTLRCVVMIFDSSFKFIREFGFRGFKPGNLIGPNEVIVDSNNRVYVSQIRKRGVSVFQISNG